MKWRIGGYLIGFLLCFLMIVLMLQSTKETQSGEKKKICRNIISRFGSGGVDHNIDEEDYLLEIQNYHDQLRLKVSALQKDLELARENARAVGQSKGVLQNRLEEEIEKNSILFKTLKEKEDDAVKIKTTVLLLTFIIGIFILWIICAYQVIGKERSMRRKFRLIINGFVKHISSEVNNKL